MDTTTTTRPQHPLLQRCERLGVRLDDLGDPGLWSLSDAEVTDLVRATETQLRRLAPWQAMAVAEAQRRDLPKTIGATSMTAWLSGTLTATPQRARQLGRLAETLDHGAPATADAFDAGDVDAEQAETIAAAVRGLPDAVGAQTRVEAERFLLDQARTHDAKTVAGLGAHLLDVVAPDLAEEQLRQRLDHDEARDQHGTNTFTGTVDRNGRYRPRGVLDAESWATVAAALGPLAKPAPSTDSDGFKVPDRRAVGQRQADALVELPRRALGAGDLLSTGHGFPAHGAITID